MNPLGNSKGQYVLGAAIMAGVITFILVLSSQSKMSTTLQTRSKEKAAMDAQMAIDQFAMELKKAYDLAAPAPESNGAAAFARTSQLAISVPTAAPPEDVYFYIPSTSFPSGSNEICVHRSDGRDALITGTPRICIHVPEDLSASIEPDGIRIDFKRPYIDPNAGQRFYSFFRLMHKILPQAAQASIEGIYQPTLPAAGPSVAVVAVNSDADPLFSYRYADFNYTPKTDRFFLNVKFCVKYANDCAADELIYQTYVFLKAPASSQGL
jgi:hypothetical protein